MDNRLLTLTLTLLISACGGTGNESNVTNNNFANNEPITGENVYEQRLDGANTFTCSTCHALSEPSPDGITRPGHPIGGAPERATFKNGRVDSFLDAANSCVTEWMGGEAWTEESPEFVALRDFLADAGDDTDDLSFEIVDPPADLTGGDADAGLARFDETCAVCHGAGGGGTNKAPPIAGQGLMLDYIAERIRLSGSTSSSVYDDLTGGRMPFWSASRLSDEDLINIAAYVADSEMVAPGNNINSNMNNANNTNNGMLRDCESTHAKVGQTLEFSTLFHDVGGTATILDDCTIELTNFTYDGTGIDVRIYAGLGGNYGSGFPISADLLSPEPYDGDTLTLQLPEDQTLDDLDGLSVWCVDVGISFGEGTFQ